MVEPVRARTVFCRYLFAHLFLHSLVSKIFPGSSAAHAPILTDTPLARIRALLDREAGNGIDGDDATIQTN